MSKHFETEEFKSTVSALIDVSFEKIIQYNSTNSYSIWVGTDNMGSLLYCCSDSSKPHHEEIQVLRKGTIVVNDHARRYIIEYIENLVHIRMMPRPIILTIETLGVISSFIDQAEQLFKSHLITSQIDAPKKDNTDGINIISDSQPDFVKIEKRIKDELNLLLAERDSINHDREQLHSLRNERIKCTEELTKLELEKLRFIQLQHEERLMIKNELIDLDQTRANTMTKMHENNSFKIALDNRERNIAQRELAIKEQTNTLIVSQTQLQNDMQKFKSQQQLLDKVAENQAQQQQMLSAIAERLKFNNTYFN